MLIGRETTIVTVKKYQRQGTRVLTDALAVEEPLEIKLGYERSGNYIRRSISITMRTPGQDFDLASGFLLTEGIITDYDQIVEISGLDGQNDEKAAGAGQSVCVELKPEVQVDLKRLERHFYTTSSCGVCGKASLEALNLAGFKALFRILQRTPPPPKPGRTDTLGNIFHKAEKRAKSSLTIFQPLGAELTTPINTINLQLKSTHTLSKEGNHFN